MKRSPILLTLLPLASLLAGCSSSEPPQQQLARCTFDAESVYPDGTWLAGEDRQSYVWLCMAAHGYQLNRSQKSCAATASSAAETSLYPQCYEPQSRLSFLLHRLERTLTR